MVSVAVWHELVAVGYDFSPFIYHFGFCGFCLFDVYKTSLYINVSNSGRQACVTVYII